MAFILNPLLRHIIIVRPSRGKSISDYEAMLRKSGDVVRERIANAPHTDKNHATSTHIIGIERWAQQHLKALIANETGPTDEYDAYRPSPDTPWEELPDMFAATRADTLALLPQLVDVPPDRTSTHNDYGAFTAIYWLQYIEGHAPFESLRLR